jgi:hypothetical protein
MNHKVQFKIQVDREVITVTESVLTGAQILLLAGKEPYSDYQLYQKLHGNQSVKIGYEQQVDLEDPGIERFTTQKKSHTDGEPKKYKIQLDREVKDAPSKCMTGRQILELFNKEPYNSYQLYLIVKGRDTQKIAYDQETCLDDPGIERFTSQKLSHQDGSSQKRDFELLEEDEAFLDSLGLSWETFVESNLNHVVIRGVRLPPGYKTELADIALRLDPTYPRGQIDMAFFSPRLARKDGHSINAVTDVIIEGRQYQQWSRHRTPDNPWREGIDCIETHMRFVVYWLENEFNKLPNAA